LVDMKPRREDLRFRIQGFRVQAFRVFRGQGSGVQVFRVKAF